MKKFLLSSILLSCLFNTKINAQHYNFCNSDSVSSYHFNLTTGDSSLLKRTYRTYNAVSQLISDSILDNTNTPPNWQSKFSYGYTNNVQTYKSYQNWNPNTSTWVNGRQIFSMLNNNNLLVSDSSLIWNNSSNSWNNEFKKTYTYNSNNQLIENKTCVWISNSSIWAPPYSRDTLTYNSTGKLATLSTQSSDGINWKNWRRYSYYYDLQNKVNALKTEYWDTLSQSYEIINIDSFIYDASNKLISCNSYGDSSSVFFLHRKEDYLYNQNGNIYYIYSYSEWNNGNYYLKSSLDIHCPNTTSIVQIIRNRINAFIYPNPSNSSQNLNIDINNSCSYQIINSIGQQVGQGNLIKGLNHVSISDLAPGNYFIQMRNGTSIDNKKFIVK